MARIELTDTPVSCMRKLADGNPGAVTVLMRLFDTAAKTDPDAAFEGLAPLLNLDTNGIYGPRIWMLYKDVCGEDIVKTHTVLRAIQLGIVSKFAVDAAIDSRKCMDLAMLLDQVQERLPAFARNIPA